MNIKAQVWIETVIYTLVAFVLIGAVLAFAKPKIEEFQDKSIIEQTLGVLEDINGVIYSIIQGGEGNKRIIEFGIKDGLMKINSSGDELIFEIDSRYTFTERGVDVQIGEIIARTERKGKGDLVTLTMNYQDSYNITYKGEETLYLITKSSTPYKIAISNEGEQNDGRPEIKFELI